MLGFSIFFHELGHYVMGRLVGARVEIFSIGYGKGIWKKKIGETTWQITNFPLGGFVKFYGDDYLSENREPGSFMSLHPVRRMVPVIGGPLFNLILGFFIFLLLHSFTGPIAPYVHIVEELGQNSPAYEGGLRDGDFIEAVNGKTISGFYDILREVLLSGGESIKMTVLRDEKSIDLHITPNVDFAGRAMIGIRPPGERRIEVNYPSGRLFYYNFSSLFRERKLPKMLRATPYLKNGDVILSVEGEAPRSVIHLQQILGEHHGQTVTVRVLRESYPWITPWITQEKTVTVPTSGEFKLSLSNIKDKKYGETVPDQDLYSSVNEHLRGLGDMMINGASPGSFERLFEKYHTPQEVNLRMGEREYQAHVAAEKIGMMGFRARDQFNIQYLPPSGSLEYTLAQSVNDTAEHVMLYPIFFYRLFSGRMSFFDNATGPVGMFAAAGIVIKSGLHDYLQLFAAISIALMVMNLLPFPVLDGGHLMFFLYEAVAGKPITPQILENIHRFAMTILLGLGLFILYRDVLFLLAL